MLSIEKAKTFCKQNGMKGLDIRGSNSIRIVIKKNNQRFNFSLDNASLTTEGLLLAMIRSFRPSSIVWSCIPSEFAICQDRISTGITSPKYWG